MSWLTFSNNGIGVNVASPVIASFGSRLKTNKFPFKLNA